MTFYTLNNMLSSLVSFVLIPCNIYATAKQNKLAFSVSEISSKNIFIVLCKALILVIVINDASLQVVCLRNKACI